MLISKLKYIHSLSLTSLILLLSTNNIYLQSNNWRTISIPISEVKTIIDVAGEMYTIGIGFNKSTDGGETWQNVTNINGFYGGKDIWMTSKTNGIAIGYDEIFKTNDGWQTATRIESINSVKSIFMIDNNIGWVAGSFGYLYKTTDAGQSWILYRQDPNSFYNSFNSVSFNTPLTGHLVGENIYKTSFDGGTTWQMNTNVPDYGDFRNVHFFDINNGWIVGGNGLIFNTTNGGNTWQRQTSNTSNTLTSISFVDSQYGWIVGEYGTVLKTTNSGLTWATENLNTTNHFRDVLAKSNGEIWIVGTHGQIFTNKPKPATLDLITSVKPAEAAADGCSVTPAGTTSYSLNTSVTINAQAADGWVWDKWAGDLSGTIKPQNLIMNGNKNVIGNFQPILTLSLSSPKDSNHCMPQLNSEINLCNAKIFVDGVDWQLKGLNFTVLKKFKPEYHEAWIEYNGNKLQGSIIIDNEGFAATLSFSPSVIITEGSTLEVKLNYKFKYPSMSNDKYIPKALTEVKDYLVSINTSQIDCEPIPVDARPGVKSPTFPPINLVSNTQTVASVWNVSKDPHFPFATIKEAIESDETLDNDLIKLCDGWYQENVTLDKQLTIFSSNGHEKTIWEGIKLAGTSDNNPILTIKKKKCKISGVSFINSYQAIKVDPGENRVSKIEIEQNSFDQNIWAVYASNIDSSHFHNNQLNDFITFNYGVENIIETNVVTSSIILRNGNKSNTIRDNLFGGSGSIEIDTNSTENNILYNKFGLSEDGNTAWKLDGIAIRMKGKLNNIESNIFANALYGIQLEHANYNFIKNNTFGLNAPKTIIMPLQTCIISDYGGSSGNVIESNIFCGSADHAIKFTHRFEHDPISNQNVIKNNLFGTIGDDTDNKLMNVAAIQLSRTVTNTLIEGNTFGRNINGLSISGKGNKIFNNKFGTNEAGTKQLPSFTGIILAGKNNIISSNVFANSLYGIIMALQNKYYEDDECSNNQIVSNKFGTDINGINPLPMIAGISLGDNSRRNFIEDNIFGEISSCSIYLSSATCKENLVRFNYIGTNKDFTKSYSFRTGIVLNNSAKNNYVSYNTIGSSSNTNKSTAIKLDSLADKNYVRNNYIGTNKTSSFKIPNSIGIDIYSNYNSITQNRVWYNYAGILEENCKNFINQNDIRYNTHNTGIHLVNSRSEITGNTIAFDEEDGIKCEQGSNPRIFGNNIFSNKGFALNNTDSKVKINAQGNYWGSSSGPGSSINGNISASSWLSTDNRLILSAAVDSLFIPQNGIDSLSIFYTNWINSNDKLNITITSNKENWISSQKSFIADLGLPNSGENKIKVVLPVGTATNEKSQVVIEAVSQTNSSLTASDTTTVMVYQRKLTYLAVRPDTISCSPGDTLYFAVAGFDQHRNEMTIIDPISWSANGGTINNSGRFIAGSTSEIFHITAIDLKNNVKSISKVKIGNATTSIEENDKIIELPTTYCLSQNYPNPFNPSTTINYQLPVSAHVTLRVYDILGREIATLVNEYQQAGSYVKTLRATSLSSGVYVYRITAGNYSKVRKMLVLK